MNRWAVLFAAIAITASAQQKDQEQYPSNQVQSGQTYTFYDRAGSGTITLEYAISGASAVSVSVQGCSVGGTCVTLTPVTGTNPYTGTTSTQVQFLGGYANYKVTPTFTGGSIGLYKVGIQAKLSTGGPSGGATIPATTSVLKGDGAGNGAAAIPGTDYVIPSGVASAAKIPGIDTTTCVYQALLTEGTGTFADTCGGTPAITPNAAWLGKFLNFTGAASSTALPAVVGTARTLTFGILFPPAKNSTGVGDFPNYGNAFSFGANKSPFCGTTASQICILDNYGAASGVTKVASKLVFYRPSGNNQASAPIPIGWHVITILCGNASDSSFDVVYMDGKVLSTTGAAVRNCPSTGNYYLGGGANTNINGGWMGQYGFVQADSARKSDAAVISDHAAIKQFLIAKGAHFSYITQDAVDGRVVNIGDSRSDGYNSTPLNTAMGSIGALPGVPTTNFYDSAVVGIATADQAAQFDAWSGYYLNGQSPCLANIWLGVNSSGSNTWNVSEEAAIKALVTKVHSRGCLAVVAEEVDAGGTAGTAQQTFLHAESLAIRTKAFSQWGADNLISLSSTQMGVTGYSQTGSPAYWNADFLHPNAAGITTYIAPAVWNVDAETLGSTATLPNIYTATTTLTAVDGYAALGSAAAGAATFTEPSCLGFSRGRVRMNRSAFVLTDTASSGETINGSASINIPAFTAVKITPVPNAPGTLGCTFTTTAP